MRRLILAFALILSMAVPAAASLQASQQPAKQPAKKAKKVWTNEDLEALRAGTRLSSFGEAQSETTAGQATGDEQPAAAAKADDKAEKEKADAEKVTLERYQKRLASLREELAKIDEEIRSVRSATTSGRTSGQGIDFTKTDAGLNTEARVAQLEQRRRELQRQIDETESEARRAGVSPGAIR